MHTTPAPPSAVADSSSPMVYVPGGTYTMGSDRHHPEERPARPAARFPEDVDTSTSHRGLRCVVRPGKDG